MKIPMNKYSLTLFLLVLIASSSIAQVEKQDLRKPLITKATATWCNICGSFGWDNFHDLLDAHNESAVFIAIHADDESQLFSETAAIFSENLIDFFGVPELFLGRDPVPFSRRWANSAKEYIDEFNEQPIPIQSNLSFQFVNNRIEVETKIKFRQSEDEPRYMSLLLIENDVVEYQFNQGPKAVHSKVLRTHITPEVFENLISTDPINANDVFNKEFSKVLDDEWEKENIEVVLIIWRKFGDHFQVVNSSLFSTSNNTTPTSDLELNLASFSIAPNLLQTSSEITISLKNNLERVSIDIYNEVGQKVNTLYLGHLKSGRHSFGLARTIFPTAGIYFVTLNDGQDIISKRIVVE